MVCQSKAVNRMQEEKEKGSTSEPWPEVDNIQSTNGVNWIDFYKTIFLVKGQPI